MKQGLGDGGSRSKVSRKDVLWLKTRHVFFVREGTKEADLQEGEVGGRSGMEETVLPGWGGPQMARPQGGAEEESRPVLAGGEGPAAALEGWPGRPAGLVSLPFCSRKRKSWVWCQLLRGAPRL